VSLYRQTRGVGRPLVLLHGWGMNAAVWAPLLGGLGEHYQVTAVELPGHGASAPADTADLSAWARACLAAAPSQAHWIGWSLGGQVALRAALAEPERVTGLTLLASTPRFVQADDWDCAMPRAVFDQFAGALSADPAATLLRFLGLQVKGAEGARETLRQLRDELGQRPPASLAGLEQGLALLARTDLRAELAALRCPTHWLFGARDTLVPARVGEAVRRLLPDAVVDVVDGAGHAPLLSHPQACIDSLLNVTT
jgi:pimeloyl-[acyl-carrier protein] methyl ester esterase